MFRWGFFHPGFFSWWWLARVGIWFVFIALVVALVIWLMLRSDSARPAPPRPPASPPAPSDDRALAILRERFARGEITREQFDEMRRALE